MFDDLLVDTVIDFFVRTENVNDRFMVDQRLYDKSGDIENARKFYFEGLRNAFNVYSNDSIYEFKEFEDQYIETLLRYTRESYEERFTLDFEF